jgi:hypothetical protein
LERVELGPVPVSPGFSAEHLYKLTDGGHHLSALSFPTPVPAVDLDIAADELVVGAEVGPEARAYPISLLRTKHVVNDRLGGEPLTITFCPRCYSGVGLDPTLEDRALTFEVYGLYNGTMVMNDEQTGSIWTPFTGEAVAGPLAGQRLRLLPVELSTFEAWIESHPSGTVPEPAPSRKPSARRAGGASNDRVLPRLVRRWDDRLAPRTLVLGIEVNGRALAYAFDPERGDPVAQHDDWHGVPVVIMAARGTWPLAYERRTEAGELLAFRVQGDRIVDDSGSTWRQGTAIDGPREGTTLSPVPSHASEWYTWAAFYPDSEIRSLGA